MDLRVHLIPQQSGEYAGTIAYKKGILQEAQVIQLWDTYLELLRHVFFKTELY